MGTDKQGSRGLDAAYALATPEDSVSYYGEWARDYDREFAQTMGYVFPREVARRFRENGGRPIARFTRKDDPTSLRFAPGYAPDFQRGMVERSLSASAFFGGRIRKFRVLSANRRVQYLFMASPTHAWCGPPQLLTTTLSTFGVRVDDVAAPEAAFMPAYEYHDEDETQIPEGFAGAPHPDHAGRADTSRWLEALPMIRDFRRQVLGRGGARRKA